MKGWILAFHLACAVTSSVFAAELASSRVRKLHLKRDEIAQVHTALGIATLIQVPDRPTSVVLGDTNAFKVEYLENAITIKPLSHSSKSNLYIYTEGRRFNVSLVTLPLPSADYIVYLEPDVSAPDPKREKWRDYTAEKKNRDFTVTIMRLGRSSDFLMIAFQVTATKAVKLKPEWIWLTQGGRTVAIQDLNLSGLEVMEKTPISGFASLKVTDLKATQAILFEVRSPAPIKIRLPEVRSWLK
jgi:hypothetical protein